MSRDIEESITACDALRARREEWEREQLAALAERRARKQRITELEIELDLERRLMASAPMVNARAAEVRARGERVKTHKPRSIAPPPLAPRVVEQPAPPRKVATKKPAPAPRPSAALGDGLAAVVRPAPAALRVERPRPAPAPARHTPAPAPSPPAAKTVPPPARTPPVQKTAKKSRPSVGERQAAAGAERRARVIELTAQGKTARQIARALDLSLQSVRGHLRAAGLSPEPALDVKGSEADWPALYREGKTNKEIADLSGWSTTHIRQKLIEAGVEMRLAGAQEMLVKAAERAAVTDISHISAGERDAVRKLAADGVPVRILASTYGYKHAEIRAIIAEQHEEAAC